MPNWDDSDCETYFNDERRIRSEKCNVFIGSGQIIVASPESDPPWKYAGIELSPGHYLLDSKGEHPGEGTLHHLEPIEILEGWWKQTTDGKTEEGMWRIVLGRSED